MEIMFDDLNEEAQKKLLDEAGVSRPEDMNWDDIPIAVVQLDKTVKDFNDYDHYGFAGDISDDTYFGEDMI
jgi:ABC-type glycerol-3-phosphate transport system substrate-binding protein